MHGAPSPTRPYQWTAAPLTKRANHHEIKETQNKPRLKITDLMTEDFPFFPNTIRNFIACAFSLHGILRPLLVLGGAVNKNGDTPINFWR
jgi:hypothetical protein